MTEIVRTLLQGVIDFAGMFPPKQLLARAAIQLYKQHHASPFRHVLGRLVIPGNRVDDVEQRALHDFRFDRCMQISMTTTAQEFNAQILGKVRRFNEYCRRPDVGHAVIDSFEVRVDEVSDIAGVCGMVPPQSVFIETPMMLDPNVTIKSIKEAGVGMKLRLGSLPPAVDVARFIRLCAGSDVRFKATQGLHNPWTEQSAGEVTHYGFLNLLIASAIAITSDTIPVEDIATILCDPTVIEIGEDRIQLPEGRSLGIHDIKRAREGGMVSFGSCSFEEPTDALDKLGLLGESVATT